MTIEIKVPDLPESVADATIATWHKQPGEAVKRDELIVADESQVYQNLTDAPQSHNKGRLRN